ncbi:ABC transporter permease [Rhodobacter sp. SGA-6-6]|uniref:ABC transporter permease n=1 Tax=Rhodobacter sp. SGA-6-6 TaxID=2710882 RepID=UPI0013ED33CD|nr:ABC transporter permease [Rhodobacter sp. SGA-6-6]NGM47495.1 ABC transporter permease [Rhodobacter sp. SGA-6-6]
MLSYIARRVTLAIIVILTVIAAMFVMMHAVPGDAVRTALGPRASEAMVEAYRARLGLDQPVWVQILRYFGAILRGDLGQDAISGTPVLQVILSQLPDTLYLIAGAMLVAVIPGIHLGVVSATHRGSLFDRVTSVLSVSVMAVPSFVIAIYLLLIFSIRLGWFPAIGSGDGLADKLHRLVLPSIALGLAWIGYLARILRASMLEVMAENHVRTARAFGISQRRIMYDYVLRIAILPTITVLGMGIGQMISGAVFAEIVFGRPGVGKLVYDAIANRNYPIVTGTVLLTTGFFVLVSLLADLLIAFLDPRVRNVISR